VEQIIDRERVRRLSHLNAIPRFRTTAIVEAPYGAHPSSCMGVYDHDRKHLKMYAQAARDPVEFKKYLDKYVYGVKSHTEYLNLIGIENLMRLRHVGGNL
jgi:glutaconate CoA-transferase subunit A